jgi:hypothetical protein
MKRRQDMEKTKTAFVETFGDSPTVRVLDFFLTFGEFDYSKSQVAGETGVSRVTIEPIWNGLIKSRMIVKTRVVGRAEMYLLNKSNPRVKELLELNSRLGSVAADEQVEEMKITVKARK